MRTCSPGLPQRSQTDQDRKLVKTWRRFWAGPSVFCLCPLSGEILQQNTGHTARSQAQLSYATTDPVQVRGGKRISLEAAVHMQYADLITETGKHRKRNHNRNYSFHWLFLSLFMIIMFHHESNLVSLATVGDSVVF